MTMHPSRRNTPQRTAILEALRRTCDHPTAAELHHLVRRDLPRVSLGTIYRNLDVLREEGLVRRLGAAGSEARWDAAVAAHDHARCRRCGIIVDVPPADTAPAPPEVAGFRIEERRLEYIGLCAGCRRLVPAGAADDS